MPTYNFAAGPATLPRPVLEQVQRELLDYQGSQLSILEISHRSPVFQIYFANLVLKWLKEQGGVQAMDELNRPKAGLVYDYLDQSKLFSNRVAPDSRSLTNIPFTTGEADLDQRFIKEAAAAGLVNLKGHRLVGGMRASLYNAMPLAGAVALRDFMHQFEQEI